MTKISEYYKIPKPTAYLDVNVERDNRLFLDPSAIRVAAKAKDPFAIAADKCLRTFFTRLMTLRLSTSSADHAAGLQMLDELHEPNETRLGYSDGCSRGHGWGTGMAKVLWDELGMNPLARNAALHRLEELPLFIDDVAYDLISDMTTRIIFKPLADFTADQMTITKKLAKGSKTVSARHFDAATTKWTTGFFNLPAPDGQPLLLVPIEWVYWRLLMDVDPFYNRKATETVKEERTVTNRDGSVSAPLKEELKEEFPDKKGLNTSQTVKYLGKRDLVGEYRSEVDHEFEPLDPSEADRRMDD